MFKVEVMITLEFKSLVVISNSKVKIYVTEWSVNFLSSSVIITKTSYSWNSRRRNPKEGHSDNEKTLLEIKDHRDMLSTGTTFELCRLIRLRHNPCKNTIIKALLVFQKLWKQNHSLQTDNIQRFLAPTYCIQHSI